MKKCKITTACLLAVMLCLINLVIPVHAEEKWPKMPKVEAPSICVMEISTGTILYEDNMDEVNYPASITKIMTALLALENSSLDEIVTFSEEAVYGNEGDTSHISRDIGEEMTMEECLYGMMLESANECAWAIGEHVGGTMKNFTKMMNQRAEELGCTNTHFNNPNGLPDEEHWTSAHDMALISAEAYKNETFRVIAGAQSYTIPPTNKHVDATPLHNHHLMVYPFHGNYEHLYDYATGGKTGYTIAAGSTLVSFAQKGDMPLVCVVMREKSPNHYTDTRTMFDYCFENFKLLRVADYETDSSTDEDTTAFARVDEDATIVIPASASFEDLVSRIDYDSDDENVLGTLVYSYADRVVGKADVRMNDIRAEGFEFTENYSADQEEGEEISEDTATVETDTPKPKDSHSIHIEISAKNIAIAIGIIAGLVVLILLLYWVGTHSYIIRQKMAGMRSRRSERNRYRTIRDTRKSRRRGKRIKKSKNLRF